MLVLIFAILFAYFAWEEWISFQRAKWAAETAASYCDCDCTCGVDTEPEAG